MMYLGRCSVGDVAYVLISKTVLFFLQGKVEKDFYGNLLSPWKPLLRKPLMAGEDEIALNPRARSVRLRVAERTTLDSASADASTAGGDTGPVA